MTFRLRLGTWNIMSGRSLSDGDADPDRLAAAAAEIAGGPLAPDVLALQEVDVGQPRSRRADLAAVVAAALGTPVFRFAPAIVGTPGDPRAWRPAPHGEPALAPGTPCYGVALVSRLPVLTWHLLRMPPARGRTPVLVPGAPGRGGKAACRVVWLHDEPRVVLAAVLDTPAGPVRVASTHLSFRPLHALRQLRRAVRWLDLPGPGGDGAVARPAGLPALLLGDLNLPAPLVRQASGWTCLADARTFPSPAPRLQLDHVAAALPWRATGPALAVRLPVSDHRALLVEARANRGG